MLLRQADERLGLTRAAAQAIGDSRNPLLITHELRDLLAQRIYAMCCGYEDLNDHTSLREDVLMQTAVGVKDTMASSPTPLPARLWRAPVTNASVMRAFQRLAMMAKRAEPAGRRSPS